MSAVILDMATYRCLDQTVSERVRDRLRNFAGYIVTQAIARALNWQKQTNCKDSEAISHAVRWAKQAAGQPLGAA